VLLVAECSRHLASGRIGDKSAMADNDLEDIEAWLNALGQ
jgi:hypothetical protein